MKKINIICLAKHFEVLKLEVKVVIDGKKIEMNEYVRSVFFEVCAGLLRTLKGVKDWKELEIQIKK
jgi:hypothetical protein